MDNIIKANEAKLLLKVIENLLDTVKEATNK